MSGTLTQNSAYTMKARHVMSKRGYDPLEALIDVDEHLKQEIAYQYGKRHGKVVELTSSGKPSRMNEDLVMMAQQTRVAIASKIMPFAYGTMPVENLNNEYEGIQPMEITVLGDNSQFRQLQNGQFEIVNVDEA